MATDSRKRLALSIIDFLSTSLKDGTLQSEDADSIEIAQNCIAECFHVDPADQTAMKDALGGQNLLAIYGVYEKLKGKNTASTQGGNSAAEARPSTPSVPKSTTTTTGVPKTGDKGGPTEESERLKGNGNMAMQRKDYKGAVGLYTQALEICPLNPIYLSNRAAAYSANSQHELAKNDAELAVATDPKYTKAWSRLGLACFALGDAKSSMEAYQKAIEAEGNGGSDAMKMGYETAKRKVEEEGGADEDEEEDEENDSAATRSAPGGGGGGMPDLGGLAAMLGGGGGAGGGGMPDLGSIMQNPMMRQMAQNLMSNPDMMNNIMNNPQLRNMASRFGGGGGGGAAGGEAGSGEGGGGGGGGGMPDLSAMMNDPNLAEMARNFMGGMGGGGAGRGADFSTGRDEAEACSDEAGADIDDSADADAGTDVSDVPIKPEGGLGDLESLAQIPPFLAADTPAPSIEVVPSSPLDAAFLPRRDRKNGALDAASQPTPAQSGTPLTSSKQEEPVVDDAGWEHASSTDESLLQQDPNEAPGTTEQHEPEKQQAVPTTDGATAAISITDNKHANFDPLIQTLNSFFTQKRPAIAERTILEDLVSLRWPLACMVAFALHVPYVPAGLSMEDQTAEEKPDSGGPSSDQTSPPSSTQPAQYSGAEQESSDVEELRKVKQAENDDAKTWKNLFPVAEMDYTRTLVLASVKDESTTWVVNVLSDILEPNGPLDVAVYVADDFEAPLRPPENKGHEANVYLSYIVDFYDSLPDVVIFMHAHRIAWHNNDLLDHDAALAVRNLSPAHVISNGCTRSTIEAKQAGSATDSRKRLALSIIDFLSTSLKDGTLQSEDADSIEIAQNCIAECFHVDPADQTAMKDALGGQNLLAIYGVYEKLKGKNTASTQGGNSAAEARPSTPSVPKSTTTTTGEKGGPTEESERLKGNGNMAMQRKDYKGAVGLYTQALEICPLNPIYLSNRAAAYSANSQHELAKNDAELAVATDPKYTKAWSRLGLACFALGDAKSSMEAYQKGIEAEGNGGSDAMKKGYETAKRKVEEEGGADEDEEEDEENDSAATRSTPGGGGGGMPDLGGLAAMLGGGGGAGGGGMPDLGSIMQNPMMRQMAQNLMSNPDMMNNIMNNPQLRNMASRFGGGGGGGAAGGEAGSGGGGGGGGMPDLSAMMNDPNLAEMARNFMGGMGGGGAGRGAGGQ
ncbi:hypothetical protein B0A55_08652 [Friedmanniomyces simplex]|uniref:STI1 domain-containing protein n=1 Tax=Friedmanniomyces simplex TaxID=329884 RepID=A0A4V6WL11_9PEZI|nr:hypothetical protein B0A55_08652 [Friedmanniomyces simplex]